MADTDWRRMIVVAVAATACGFNSGGDGADSTGETSSTSATDPSTDPATTNPTTTNPTTTDPATTDPVTTDPSTEPTTTDPTTEPTTTEPTTDPTTGEDTTETDPSQGSSTGGDPGSYGPCDGNTCPDDQTCAVAQNENNIVVGNTCRPPCEALGDCPAPPSGSPQLFCPAPDYPWCVLGCQMGICPDAMECYPTPFGDLCYWPI